MSDERERIKADWIADRGSWSDQWQAVYELDAGFLDAYREFSMVARRKQHLDPVTQSLVNIAISANATHLYAPGIRTHVRAALDAGAEMAEIMEVLELCATLGIHAMNIGVPILVDVMRELGLRDEPAPLDAHQERLKEEFVRSRGYWHAFWDEMLELDPEVFAAYTAFSSVPWRTGVLSPKVKELIYITFDTAATHLYEKGLRLHIVNALGYGATPQEILEVMELASLLGIHAVTVGAPILRDEGIARGIHTPS
jgi:alkylhydroperoxidase/carboxymuconolactone decarboxylase family protein YurZ